MCFEVLFFDLDDTLYPATSGIWQAIGKRMDEYMLKKFDLLQENVGALREDLYYKYGTTLRGLREVYHIDESEFLNFVHDIPIHEYLKPDPSLAQVLSSVSQRKVIFTNADVNHANRVLNNLGIADFFEQVIDIQRIHPFCKPMNEAFMLALEAVGIENPSKCVLIDDSFRNLVVAHQLGFYTIQVGTITPVSGIDAGISSINDLSSVLSTDLFRSIIV
jgi:pyrimidine 5'-nucleotidase